MERTSNESIFSHLPCLKDEAGETVKKTALKDMKARLEELRKERRWSPSLRDGNSSKMESRPEEPIFYILPRLKEEADETVKKTALKHLKSRLKRLRKETDDAKNAHKLRTKIVMGAKNGLERWLAGVRGKGRSEHTTGVVEMLVMFRMGIRNDIARETALVGVEYKAAKEMIQIIEDHNAELQDLKNESLISALEEFEALKTSLGRAQLERTPHLEALKKLNEQLTELGEWIREQLRLRYTDGEVSSDASTQAGVCPGRQHRRRVSKTSFDKALMLQATLAIAEKIMERDSAELSDAGLNEEGIAETMEQESFDDIVTRLKTESDPAVKQAGLKDLIASLQSLTKICDASRDEFKLRTEELVVKKKGLEQQLAVLSSKGCRSVTHKGVDLKILQASVVAQQKDVVNDTAIFSMKHCDGKDMLQCLKNLSGEVQDFQDESFIPVLEELEALMNAAKANLATQVTHLEALKKVKDKCRELGECAAIEALAKIVTQLNK